MKKGYLLILMVAAFVAVIASSITVYATGRHGLFALSLPHTFTAGSTAVASEVNENFTYLANAIEDGPIVYKTAGSFLTLAAGEENTVYSPNCETGDIAVSCQCIAENAGDYLLRGMTAVEFPNASDRCSCAYVNNTGSSGQVRAYAICMKAQSDD
ncbi:MAG: hypothetical protein GX444_15085 [Myxococcales bacterium]|nr:hypothetical protein [Myxococcales bacterium]